MSAETTDPLRLYPIDVHEILVDSYALNNRHAEWIVQWLGSVARSDAPGFYLPKDHPLVVALVAEGWAVERPVPFEAEIPMYWLASNPEARCEGLGLYLLTEELIEILGIPPAEEPLLTPVIKIIYDMG